VFQVRFNQPMHKHIHEEMKLRMNALKEADKGDTSQCLDKTGVGWPLDITPNCTEHSLKFRKLIFGAVVVLMQSNQDMAPVLRATAKEYNLAMPDNRIDERNTWKTGDDMNPTLAFNVVGDIQKTLRTAGECPKWTKIEFSDHLMRAFEYRHWEIGNCTWITKSTNGVS
ncbi:hypothetical protein PFISCL1PPCAC_11950, partial [Pristionchus fissidentatus]